MTPADGIAYVAEYGVTNVLLGLLFAAAAYVIFVVWPKEAKHRQEKEDAEATHRYEADRRSQELQQVMAQQVALSTKAIETANLVIQQNSEELKSTRSSHTRLGQRMEGVEKALSCVEEQVVDVLKDTSAIKAKVGAA